jgi:hypothetical protein
MNDFLEGIVRVLEERNPLVSGSQCGNRSCRYYVEALEVAEIVRLGGLPPLGGFWGPHSQCRGFANVLADVSIDTYNRMEADARQRKAEVLAVRLRLGDVVVYREEMDGG